MKIFYLIFFFILGTVIGSFLCVVGLRLPKNIDFVKGKSRCDACGHGLHFYELIPIFSYIFLRGRCLKCHKKIDSIIPISEILGGLLFSTAYYLFGFSYNLVIALLIAALFIIIVTTDVTYYIIPDEIIITFSILFLIVEFLAGDIKNVGMHLLTGILLFIIMYLIMGVLTTLVNWVVYAVTVRALPISGEVTKVAVANVIAWIAGVIFAYFTNKIWVFESYSWKLKFVLKEMSMFVGARLITGCIEWLGVPALVKLGLNQKFLGIDGMFSKVLVSVIVVILNYVFSKLLIFKNKENQAD